MSRPRFTYGYIYMVTNSINDTIYIGQKRGFFTPKYLGSGDLIRAAVKKHGSHLFRAHILEFGLDEDELNNLERQWISIMKFYGAELYNLDGGGKNSSKTPETRKKIADRRKGYIMPMSDRLHLSKVLKGAVQSPARIASIKRAQKARIGLRTPVEVIEKIKRSLEMTTKNKGINCWKFGKKVPAEEIARRTETRRINRLKKLGSLSI